MQEGNALHTLAPVTSNIIEQNKTDEANKVCMYVYVGHVMNTICSILDSSCHITTFHGINTSLQVMSCQVHLPSPRVMLNAVVFLYGYVQYHVTYPCLQNQSNLDTIATVSYCGEKKDDPMEHMYDDKVNLKHHVFVPVFMAMVCYAM